MQKRVWSKEIEVSNLTSVLTLLRRRFENGLRDKHKGNQNGIKTGNNEKGGRMQNEKNRIILLPTGNIVYIKILCTLISFIYSWC